MAYTVTNNPWTSEYAVGIGTGSLDADRMLQVKGGTLKVEKPQYGWYVAEFYQTHATDSPGVAIYTQHGASGGSADGNNAFGVHNAYNGNIFQVQNSGKVGIGTGAPKGPLDVYGHSNHLLVVSGSGGKPLVSIGTTTNPNNSLLVKVEKPYTHLVSFENTSTQANDAHGVLIVAGNGTAGTLSLQAQDETPLVQFQGNGNVGIGTTSPSSYLHVYTDSTDAYTPTNYNDYSLLTLQHPNADTYYSGIRFTNSAGNYEKFIGSVQTSGNTADIVFQGYDRGAGAYKEYVRIQEDGNVGIGTTSPSYMLEVAGTFYSAGSSVAYKENIEDLEVDPSLIHSLRAVSYDYKKKYKDFGYDVVDGKQMGLISEEVAETIPELAIMKDGIPKNVDYQKLAVVLLAEVQNLKKEIEEIKSK